MALKTIVAAGPRHSRYLGERLSSRLAVLAHRRRRGRCRRGRRSWEITLATRQTPRPAAGPEGQAAARADAADAGGRSRIRAAFRDWPNGSLDTMEEPRPRVPARSGRPALPRASRSSGRATPATPRTCCGGRRGSGATRRGSSRPTTCSTRSSCRTTRFPAARGRTRCSSAARASRRRATSTRRAKRLTSGGAAARRTTTRRRSRRPSARFDKDNLYGVVLAARAAHARFPRSQSVRYYLGLLLAWTGQRDASIAQFQKAVALGPSTPLGKAAAQFLDDVRQRPWDQPGDQMSRSAYGVRPVADATVPASLGRRARIRGGRRCGEDGGGCGRRGRRCRSSETRSSTRSTSSGDASCPPPRPFDASTSPRSTTRRRSPSPSRSRRLAPALPQGHRQGQPADRRAGGGAREADRARRPSRRSRRWSRRTSASSSRSRSATATRACPSST